MWGRKEKRGGGERRKVGVASKSGGGLPFMGIGMPPGGKGTVLLLSSSCLT